MIGLTAAGNPGSAADPSRIVDAVLDLHATIPADARTAPFLGRSRDGTGVLIDSSGLIVTIGYLILEADSVEVTTAAGATLPASIVAYDHRTGFGLVRAHGPIDTEPVRLGDSSTLTQEAPLLVISNSAGLSGQQVMVASRREFAGYWEYLLDDAIFTSPPHRTFAGAALIDTSGELVGIGSLFVNNAQTDEQPLAGNMFVPINDLKLILGDLLASGRQARPANPWLGITSREIDGQVRVARVAKGGPAAMAGISPGDVIVGVGGETIDGLADFYRKVWGRGDAGVDVPLDIRRGVDVIERSVQSSDRYRWLRLNRSF